MNLPGPLLRKYGSVCVALLISASPILSQQNGTRSIRVLHITEPIKIDGRLDEPGWSQADMATDFRQQEPSEGEPASENTEVRLLVDDKNLYVGVHAFDSEPSRINSRELVRDATFSNDDKVEILLDTYHMNIEEKNSADAIRAAGGRLYHFHACGCDRGTPGNDHIEWKSIVTALKEIKYNGLAVIESFTTDVKVIAKAASIWRQFEPSQDDIAVKGLSFLKKSFE